MKRLSHVKRLEEMYGGEGAVKIPKHEVVVSQGRKIDPCSLESRDAFLAHNATPLIRQSDGFDMRW